MFSKFKIKHWIFVVLGRKDLNSLVLSKTWLNDYDSTKIVLVYQIFQCYKHVRQGQFF